MSSIMDDISKFLIGGLPATLDNPTANTSTASTAAKQYSETDTPSGVSTTSAAPVTGVTVNQMLLYGGLALGVVVFIIFMLKKRG